jgi:hypothetical protein
MGRSSIKFKWSETSNILVTVLVIVYVTFILFAAYGCTPATKARNLKVLWHDGNCVLYVEGLTVEQARGLKEKWEFKDCNVVITENDGGSKK